MRQGFGCPFTVSESVAKPILEVLSYNVARKPEVVKNYITHVRPSGVRYYAGLNKAKLDGSSSRKYARLNASIVGINTYWNVYCYFLGSERLGYDNRKLLYKLGNFSSEARAENSVNDTGGASYLFLFFLGKCKRLNNSAEALIFLKKMLALCGFLSHAENVNNLDRIITHKLNRRCIAVAAIIALSGKNNYSAPLLYSVTHNRGNRLSAALHKS